MAFEGPERPRALRKPTWGNGEREAANHIAPNPAPGSRINPACFVLFMGGIFMRRPRRAQMDIDDALRSTLITLRGALTKSEWLVVRRWAPSAARDENAAESAPARRGLPATPSDAHRPPVAGSALGATSTRGAGLPVRFSRLSFSRFISLRLASVKAGSSSSHRLECPFPFGAFQKFVFLSALHSKQTL